MKSAKGSRREARLSGPFGPLGFSLGVVAIAAVTIVIGFEDVQLAVAKRPAALLFWGLTILAIDLFPVSVRQVRLTLDMPVLLAVAVLHQPAVGAALAFVFALDKRELRGEVAVSQALFNRAQVSLSVASASWVFASVAQDIRNWPMAGVGLIAAVMSDYLVNVSLVSIHFAGLQRINLTDAFKSFRLGSRLDFVLTYLGTGLLGGVLAFMFLKVGGWSVLAFMLPLLVARQSLARVALLEAVSLRLKQREHMLEESLTRMSRQREDERRRIYGELHDTVLQTLTQVWLVGKRIQQTERDVRASLRTDLTVIVDAAEESMRALRETIHGLRVSALGTQGLCGALDSLVKEERLRTEVKIELLCSNTKSLNDRDQVLLYDAARELLLNALQHAEASRVKIFIEVVSDAAELRVADDGRGFNPRDVDESNHFGLALVRERVGRVGGSISIRSGPNKGSQLFVRLPLEGASEEPATLRLILPVVAASEHKRDD